MRAKESLEAEHKVVVGTQLVESSRMIVSLHIGFGGELISVLGCFVLVQ